MNLYILPIETFEEHIRADLNIFKRDTFLYQYKEDLFLFYRWDIPTVGFSAYIKGFSDEIKNYKIRENFKPYIYYSYTNSMNILRQYVASGVKINIKIFYPKNNFIRDSLIFIASQLTHDNVECVKLDNYTHLSQFFYKEMRGSMASVNTYPYIFIMYFLSYLNHIIMRIYAKTEQKFNINIPFIMLSRLYNNQADNANYPDKKSFIAIAQSHDSDERVNCYKLVDEIFERSANGETYPCRTWGNRVVPVFYDDVTYLFSNNEEVYIQDDDLSDETPILVGSEELFMPDLYFIFENYLPQYTIARAIEDNKDFSDDWGKIYGFPEVLFVPDNFEQRIKMAITRITFTRKIEDIFDYIERTIEEIANDIKGEVRRQTNSIGVCPSCGHNSVIRARNCFCCTNCNFHLWDKTMQKRIGTTLNKRLMSKMLAPNNQFKINMRDTGVRLIFNELSEEEARKMGSSQFWDLEITKPEAMMGE